MHAPLSERSISQLGDFRRCACRMLDHCREPIHNVHAVHKRALQYLDVRT